MFDIYAYLEILFLHKFSKYTKKATEIRQKYDENGQNIPVFLIASITEPFDYPFSLLSFQPPILTGTMKYPSSIGFFYRLEMIRIRISCPRLLSMANLTRNCGVCKLLLTIVWPSASRHLPINGKIAPQRVLISFFDILYPSEKEIIISLNA